MEDKRIYVIKDSCDGEIFFLGTLPECKDWWWSKLVNGSEVGGYSLSLKQ